MSKLFQRNGQSDIHFLGGTSAIVLLPNWDRPPDDIDNYSDKTDNENYGEQMDGKKTNLCLESHAPQICMTLNSLDKPPDDADEDYNDKTDVNESYNDKNGY